MAIWEFLCGEDRTPKAGRICSGRIPVPDDIPLIRFNGQRRSATWRPWPVRFHQGRVVDFIPVGVGAVTCTFSVWQVIRPYVESEVEVLPVVWPEGVNFVFSHVINLIDCVDYERTTWQDDRKKRADQIYFREELVKDCFLFKIPLNPATITYATDNFKQLVEANGLTGAAFRPSSASHDPTNYL